MPSEIQAFGQRSIIFWSCSVVNWKGEKPARRLSGAKTFFLPFNKGHGHGAGNPPNENNYRTAYLWEEVLTKDIRVCSDGGWHASGGAIALE